MAESEQFERGLEIRREVLGTDYVDANLAGTDEFMMGFQRLLTEWAWGYAWSRPGLDRKTRSMLNLAILTALGRPQELGIYVKGALSTGVSVAEIQRVGKRSRPRTKRSKLRVPSRQRHRPDQPLGQCASLARLSSDRRSALRSEGMPKSSGGEVHSARSVLVQTRTTGPRASSPPLPRPM